MGQTGDGALAHHVGLSLSSQFTLPDLGPYAHFRPAPRAAASAASDASDQATRARRVLRCVMLFHLLPCGGVEEASLRLYRAV